MNKLEKVRVIRYVRPSRTFYRVNDNPTFENHFHSADNLGGLTLVFDMDYNDRTVAISFSLAADDENFNKKEGLKVALDKGVERVISLDAFQKLADNEGGFVDAFWSVLKTSESLGVALSKREKAVFKKVPFYSWR